ncbi:Dam family site-specific DNA-(adenine-N6)-methyltransferase [Streptococcus anginosus]|nr:MULTISPECIES: Dam family site-specific DNA-(adenine-N6)-methyltransferase [Streptococcus]KAA9295188.1 Dam family site-specific DNA-(adenine-N6)-methyltransferase [Streptococcus anginosus]KUM01537.1 DNA adenine methylase [Streptococcus anginosus]OHS91356.1 DNA adenine methylase [Streptococcus sp. HMSC36C04]PRT66724.1 DNA adenine methylase [Streptococcus anginosus]PRT70804.1 DNA adenine methylase [Streptococcus anginosus]
MQPFVKWAGGKRQLLPEIQQHLPKKFNTYYEPFIGGGALLFELAHNNSIISDNNHVLIDTYIAIREHLNELLPLLDNLQTEHNSFDDKEKAKEFYYDKRKEFNEFILDKDFSLKRNALFMYLNKACFNGLYRVNGKGLFNVPSNQKIKINIYDKDNLKQISDYLQNVQIFNQDFEVTVKNAKQGDLVFFDSPYAPLNPTSFDSYTKEGFSTEEHIRLSNVFKQLSEKGVYCILTNHNTEFIRELYSDFNLFEVDVKRLINRDAKNRTGKELIVTNFD